MVPYEYRYLMQEVSSGFLIPVSLRYAVGLEAFIAVWASLFKEHDRSYLPGLLRLIRCADSIFEPFSATKISHVEFKTIADQDGRL